MIDFRTDLDGHETRLRKMEIQNAAHWVVHTITVGAIATVIGNFLNVG